LSFVIDNSVALAWCFEDEQTPALMTLLDRLVEQGALAPQLWPIEALNGLLSAEKRGRIDRSSRLRLLGFLSQLPIAIDEETAGRVWSSTGHLADEHGLTAYDAAYLELAVRQGVPMATTDTALVRAAQTIGVEILPG
jgi:predicted nucleic acid-binding protein